MVIPLTKKEKLILEFIRSYNKKHGYSPSLYEIKDHFALSAVSTVHEHVKNLKRKGYIAKEIGQARSLQIIDTELNGQEMLEVPVSLKLNCNSVLVEMNGEVPSIYLHRKQLDKNGKYLGILIECDLYKDSGILKGDLLVFKEDVNYKNGDVILACSNSKFYYLGKLNTNGKSRALEKLDKQKALLRSFTPKARFISLFRDLRSRN